MKIDSFIFNWNGYFESAKLLESTVSAFSDRVNVINSDDHNQLNHWHNIGNKCFFTDQWFKCLEVHDSEKILFHVQADTYYNQWDNLAKDALYYMNKYNAGIYYPKVRNVEWFDDNTTEILGIKMQDDNIKCIANGDETVWFIHPAVIKYFKDNNLDKFFLNNRIGWGWDVVFCGISYILGMPVIRDSNHIIEHDLSRGYANEEAESQFYDLIHSLPFELCWYAHNSRVNDKRVFLKKYIDKNELP